MTDDIVRYRPFRGRNSMANKQAEEPKKLIVDTRTKAQIANRRTSQSDRGRVTTEVTEVVVTRSKVQSGSLVIGERRYVNAYVRNFLYFRIPRDPLEACVIYGSYRSALAIVYGLTTSAARGAPRHDQRRVVWGVYDETTRRGVNTYPACIRIHVLLHSSTYSTVVHTCIQAG